MLVLRSLFLMLMATFFSIGMIFAVANDLVAYIEKASTQTKPVTIAPLPELKMFKVKPMNVSGLRNPFDTPVKLLAKEVTTTGVNDNKQYKPDLVRQKTALEQVPLADLKFSGVIEQAGALWAIITNVKNQHAEVVQTGDYIGLDYGRINEITAKYVKIDERKKGKDGQWNKETTYLNLEPVE